MMSQNPPHAASAKVVPAVTTTAKAEPRVQQRAGVLELFRQPRKHWSLIAIYIFLSIMTVFSLFPIYYVFQASLNSTQALITTQLQLIPTRPTLENYRYIIQQDPFLRWIANSILVCAMATIIALVCCTTGAYALSRFRFRGRQMSLLFLIGLQAFPGLLAIYAYYSILSILHLDGTLLGLSIVYASGYLVFGVWNLKGYFDTIPFEMEEAARVDGASYFAIFTRVILPLAAPALAATALFMFIGGWNEFVLAKLILNPDNNSLTVPVGLFQLQQDQYTPWGDFAAAAVLVSTPLMVLFLYLQRYFKAGLTIGSVKG